MHMQADYAIIDYNNYKNITAESDHIDSRLKMMDLI